MPFFVLVTLTFKLVCARDQTCLPCEFGANLFSGFRDILCTNKKTQTDGIKNKPSAVITGSGFVQAECLTNSFNALTPGTETLHWSHRFFIHQVNPMGNDIMLQLHWLSNARLQTQIIIIMVTIIITTTTKIIKCTVNITNILQHVTTSEPCRPVSIMISNARKPLLA